MSKRKAKIGKGNGEVLAICKLDMNGCCVGVSCGELYFKCWKHLNPDEEGFIEVEFKTVKIP